MRHRLTAHRGIPRVADTLRPPYALRMFPRLTSYTQNVQLRRSIWSLALVALAAPLLWGCGVGDEPKSVDASLAASNAGSDTEGSQFPTLDDFWNGDAEFQVDAADTGLPMGESDTVVLSDGRYRAYVHASDRSLGVVDSCGAPVEFPGCLVAFESANQGRSFEPVHDETGQVTCMIPCRTCPCDSRRDHVDQQQYPRVIQYMAGDASESTAWLLVYEYRGSVFLRSSDDGLGWSDAAQVPQTGTWRTWLMPCRSEESIGPHPYAASEFDCLVGGPPGLAMEDDGGLSRLFVFVGLGQNPGSMGCYRGLLGTQAALLRKCENNPLFTGASTYGEGSGAAASEFFDFRTISSADVIQVSNRYYMFYEGVRGPDEGAAGDTQFALGLARSLTREIDGPWETYAHNPILVDLPGNVGVGHADVVVDHGETILFTSLDGESRSRLTLRWK